MSKSENKDADISEDDHEDKDSDQEDGSFEEFTVDHLIKLVH